MPSYSPQTAPLKASVKDGMAAAVMLGSGEAYFGAFGVFLHASPVQIGALASLPTFLGAVLQALGVWLIVRIKDRRKLILRAAALQGMLWLPIALLAFWHSSSSATNILIALVSLYFAVSAIITPTWNSLIGDLVPASERGRFFGFRNKRAGITTFIALLCAGQILSMFDRIDRAAYGFCAIFLFAAGARAISYYWLTKYENPVFHHEREHHFSFLQFLMRSPKSNFARFVFFVSLMSLGVFISSPYFAVFMLRELQFSYTQFTIINAASTLAQFLTIQRWGSLGDKFGTKRVLEVCSVGVALCPFLWLVSTNFYYLLIIQTYAGFVWAGYNLSVANFLFDAVTPPKRARCVAYQAIVNGIFVLGGSWLGGYLVTHLDRNFWIKPLLSGAFSSYLTIFLVSGIVRLVTSLGFLRLFDEVRKVERVRHRQLIFELVHLRPNTGSTFSVSSTNTGANKEETYVQK